MAIVTISRQAGAGEESITPLAANGLGYEQVDSVLLSRVAENVGKGVKPLVIPGAELRSPVSEWLTYFISPWMAKLILRDDGHLNPERYIDYLRSALNGLAERGNVIIIGRGGQQILKSRGNAFHVRLVADRKVRISRIKQQYDISDEEAAVRIDRSDSMRRNFIQKYFQENWDDPSAYHLVLNTSKLTCEHTAAIIIESVQQFASEHDCLFGMRERRKGIDRRSIERRRGERRKPVSIREISETELGQLTESRPLRSEIGSDRRQNDRRKKSRRAEDRKKIAVKLPPAN